MNSKITPPLNEIIETAKNGMKESALALTYMRLSQYPDEHDTLLVLAGLTPDLDEGIETLKKILKNDPSNVNAQKGLDDLQSRKEKSKPSISTELFSGSDFIEKAGKVIWIFRGVNKPIKEACENDIISKKDLGWAAMRAYNAPTRWAAAIYHQRDKLLSQKMTLEEARKTNWTYKSLNQPAGELLDTHTVKLKNLCSAIINSSDISLAMAASTLGFQIVENRLENVSKEIQTKPVKQVSHRKEKTRKKGARPPVSKTKKPASKPTSPKRTKELSLQVYKGSNYLKEKELETLKKKEKLSYLGQALIVIGLLISLGFIILPLIGTPLSSSKQWYLIGGGTIIMLFVNSFIAPRFENAAQEYKNYLAGREGEDRFEDVLKKVFKNGWLLFRNIDLPDKYGDIDALLIGPKGVYACEIKAFSGHYRNIGNRWQYRSGGVWHNYKKNPSKQATLNAARLHDFLLENADIDIWVDARIVWVGDKKLSLSKPAVRVWNLQYAKYINEDINDGRPLDYETIDKIVTALKMYLQGYRHTGKSN
ncbi:MAG: hypothetical protein DRI32_04045 [Chloroflexi bacterium]|nr:MAG: hypothetical protein DRI32_04045 [Chloroflexota bacterium]